MKDGIFNYIRLKKKKKNNHYFFHFSQTILSLNLIFLISYIPISKESQKFLISNSSEVKLVFLGSGNQSILNDTFYLEPAEVIVNGISRDSCKYYCELEYEENNVTLYFNEPVNSSLAMFSQ